MNRYSKVEDVRRLRNVKGSRETIAASEFTINEPNQFKGKWKEEVFGNENPIHIEIGMGKGKFIMELAAMNPDINYIGIEKYSSVLVRAIEKRKEQELLFLSEWMQKISKRYLRNRKWIRFILIFLTHGQKTVMLRED